MRCAHSVSAASTQGGGGGGGGGDDEGHALTPSSKRAVRTNLCSPRHRLFFSLPPPPPRWTLHCRSFLLPPGAWRGKRDPERTRVSAEPDRGRLAEKGT